MKVEVRLSMWDIGLMGVWEKKQKTMVIRNEDSQSALDTHMKNVLIYTWPKSCG